MRSGSTWTSQGTEITWKRADDGVVWVNDTPFQRDPDIWPPGALYVKRREIRSRFRPAPTPEMCAVLHGLAAIGPEAEASMRWNWPAWIPARPFDWTRDA